MEHLTMNEPKSQNTFTISPNNTTFIDEFSNEIFDQTYRFFENETINDAQMRTAINLAEPEDNYSKSRGATYWAERFNYVLEDFKLVTGGRILSNAGTGLKGTTYINCFVDGFTGKSQDSMESIMNALKRQAMILKSEGGYGFCADVMRPRGTYVNGIGNESPGSVKMLEMWDKQSEIVTAGSGRKNTRKKGKIKIRKGAQMVTMSIWHPDIEEFIKAKQTPGRLTKFNMSCLITDEFMEAKENKKPWSLEFPSVDDNIKRYDNEWDGNLKKWKDKGYETVVYKTYDDAEELWDIIMESTYNRNEPGVLFVDTMNRLNNLRYCEYISATNPCGEQILPIGGVCLLGSLNLTQCVDFKNKDWDYKKLDEIIPLAVRLLDNVNDKTNVPLRSQRENLRDKRRIGLGVMGYGSALMMLKVRYGSKKALELTEKLESHIANKAYQASALLAKEKGPFPMYDEQKYLSSEFIKNLNDDTIRMIRNYGIRNSHLLSIQPTGNTSILANVVSGGLEPVFMPQYVRTSMMPYAPEGLVVPELINFKDAKAGSCETEWSWIKEGDENVLRTEFNGYIWKIDQARGLLRETVVKDYAVRFLEEKGQWKPEAKWAATTTELGIDEHIKTMEVFAKYIDSAMSKTVNIPNEYSYEDFKKLYTSVHKTGIIKGCTTYRAGTMTEVLGSVNKSDDDKIRVPKTDAPDRPKILNCDVHHLTAMGKKWIVLVGILEGDPYEVFAFKTKSIHLPYSVKTGKLKKAKRGVYNLECDNGLLIENIADNFETDEQEALTRLISCALRHGANIQFVFEQLSKSEGGIISFSRAIARTLKKYLINGAKANGIVCSQCDSSNIVYQEGCEVCLDCGCGKCS